jgi:multicomponent Na+:H+ antiporter subunit E
MRFIVPVLGWLILTGADPAGLAFGAVVAGLAILASHRLGSRFRTISPLALLPLLPRFLWRSLLGGIDVAWRALDPTLPLRPGWARVKTRLPAGTLRVTIGGEFSLMPGTLVAGSRRDELIVHLLDTSSPVEADMAAEEARLLRASRSRTGGAG